MTERRPAEEREKVTLNLRSNSTSGSRLPSVSFLLRPLARAPGVARELAIRVERIADAATRTIGARQTKFSPVMVSFMAFVVAPSLAAVLYFAFIASDQYEVETRFAVRSVESEPTSTDTESGGGSASSSSSFSFTATGQNAYIVTSYIRSRAILDDLAGKLELRDLFRRPEADFLARLKRDASIDELTNYWSTKVTTYVDALSGIVTVHAKAFRQEDALTLGRAIVSASETLVNRISERARRDATTFAEKEVRRTFVDVQTALGELHAFRDKAGLIDPTQATGEIEKLLIPLLIDKIKLESDLFVAGREMNEEAPSIRVLKSRLATVEQQIASLKAKLTGVNARGDTVAASLQKFEELELQRGFAERLYMLAQADLDRAQMRANRQNVYLTVFVPPSLPEEARYPRRIAFPILFFLGALAIWSIVIMIIASVEDHRV